MTTHRSRVDRVGRQIGVGAGAPLECPVCHGAGRAYDVDGAHQTWVAEQRVERIKADRAGVTYEPSAPEPDEATRICWSCSGTGVVSAATMHQHEQAAAEGSRIVETRIAAIKRAAIGRASSIATDRPGLHAVPNDVEH